MINGLIPGFKCADVYMVLGIILLSNDCIYSGGFAVFLSISIAYLSSKD